MAATKYENESSGSSAERVQEGLALPVFDSLPATAGLSNLEAFQLSLKHALALLPQMLALAVCDAADARSAAGQQCRSARQRIGGRAPRLRSRCAC